MEHTEDKFKKDEEQDILLVNEILDKEDNMLKVGSVLTQKFKQKYGPEFGGLLAIEYDLLKSIFILQCGKDYYLEIDENDVEDIPIRIKSFREQAIADKNKPKPTLIPKPAIKKEELHQKMKTEDGKEIKVDVKKTKDAEKEMDDDYEDADEEDEK
ncbi:MAG: hypothetical protein Q8O89_00685 [Nanoarchaeota archaeon]|nr:hypothetical protein [Nanoarchaeota archaeon]